MASAAGLLTLFEEGPTKVSGLQHAWNLVQIDGIFYYIDCTSVSLDKNGEAYDEFLLGQDTMFNLRVTPKNDIIETTYSNISKDDWSKEYSKCNGNHDLNMDAPSHSGARCGIKGYNGYKCKNCNYVYREWIPALEHIWDNGTVTQKQDCTHPEITTYRCTRKDVWGTNGTCDGTKEVETKPSLGGHKWQPGEITKAPTCTTAGEQQYTCTVCNQTKTEPVKATGHNWDIKITKESNMYIQRNIPSHMQNMRLLRKPFHHSHRSQIRDSQQERSHMQHHRLQPETPTAAYATRSSPPVKRSPKHPIPG